MLKHNKFNFWTIPVGKVDKGDTIEETLIREIKEEVDIDIDDFEVVSMETRNYKRKGKVVAVKQYLYKVTDWSGEVNNNEDEKHSDMKWMSLKDIKEMDDISHATKDMIRHFVIIDDIK